MHGIIFAVGYQEVSGGVLVFGLNGFKRTLDHCQAWVNYPATHMLLYDLVSCFALCHCTRGECGQPHLFTEPSVWLKYQIVYCGVAQSYHSFTLPFLSQRA